MVAFLESHFRYYTMNSWNNASSYANNVKIDGLGFDRDIERELYDIIQTSEFAEIMGDIIDDFACEHNFAWQAGFNGHSGGYLVLYSGKREPTGHKSYCTSCGQPNFGSIEESGQECGFCHEMTRVDYTTPPMRVVALTASVDQGEDFNEWDICSLRERVEIVQSFDRMCDLIVAETKGLAENYSVETETVYIPQERLVLVKNTEIA